MHLVLTVAEICDLVVLTLSCRASEESIGRGLHRRVIRESLTRCGLIRERGDIGSCVICGVGGYAGGLDGPADGEFEDAGADLACAEGGVEGGVDVVANKLVNVEGVDIGPPATAG